MEKSIEKIEPQPTKIDGRKNNGGARKGAGMPKGAILPATLEKKLDAAYLQGRANSARDMLVNAQFTLAKGVSYLYKIEKEQTIGPKGGVSYRAKKPELVTSQWEIESYLQGLVDEANGEGLEDKHDRSATYYYLTTAKPENNAIDSILDRTMGKPKDTIKHEGTMGIYHVIQQLKYDKEHRG